MFLDVKYPNSKLVSTALAAFHHVPIRVGHNPPLLHSLIVLSKNDGFWSHLAAANKTRRWSAQLVISYFLVIFVVLLTIAQSFGDLKPRPSDTGYGIIAIWTFLLPLIIGWLHVGCESEPSHLRDSLAAANQNTWVATEQRNHPVRMSSPMAIDFAEADSVDLARTDELKPVPVFNYSRAFVTPMMVEFVLRLMKCAAENAGRRIPVGNSLGGEVAVWEDGEGDEIRPENRVGTASEVVEYSTRILQQPEVQASDSEMTNTTYPPIEEKLITPLRWAPGIWQRVFISSILALGLHWGTIGAAVFIHYQEPPWGLGCRSFAFLLYGVLGTLSFFFFLESSILAHMSRPLPGRVPTRSRSRTFQNAGAIICRWLAKFTAIVSAIFILTVCFLHVAGTFDNCFSSSTTFNNGRQLITFDGAPVSADEKTMRTWALGLVIAFSTAILFGSSMYMSLPPRRSD